MHGTLGQPLPERKTPGFPGDTCTETWHGHGWWQHTLILRFLSDLEPSLPVPPNWGRTAPGARAAAPQGGDVRFIFRLRGFLCLHQPHLDKQQYINKRL